MAKEIVCLVDREVWLAEWRDSHRAGGPGSGRFSREPSGELDPFSCADFCVIDYTLGPWPVPPSEQDVRVDLLRGFQSPETGFFEVEFKVGVKVNVEDARARRRRKGDVREVTAYFMSALELLGARPLHPMRGLDAARTPGGIEDLLEGLDWTGPRPGAAGGAVALAFALTGDVGPEWFERYFAWLDREADPKSGFWRRKAPAGPLDAIEGAHAHLLIYDRFNRPLPYPAKAVASVLEAQRDDGLFDAGGPGWRDLAALCALSLSFRQCGSKARDVRICLTSFARAAASRLADAAFRDSLVADPHGAAGLLSAVAVLARTLPGSVKSRRPLRFFGDRHLFV